MNEELFYCACWRELQHFLSDLVIRDTVEEYPNARDFLALMPSGLQGCILYSVSAVLIVSLILLIARWD